MTTPTIYLDANASERPRPGATQAMLSAQQAGANPSSLHGAGRLARALLDDARREIGARFGAAPDRVVFTSGGTEANALALHGVEGPVVIGATEHDAVRQAVPGAMLAPVLADGQADLPALDALLASLAGTDAVVCLMAANNETGVLHPLREAAALCRRHGAALHVDAVQAAGRLDLADYLGAGVRSLALSGHKLGGPQGAGALVLAEGVEPAALMRGGGQERGRRGGTPAVPAIAGMRAALAACSPHAAARLLPLRARIEAAAVAAGAIVCGGTAPRLANTSCLALPGVAAQTQLIALDLDGICVSAGAACSAGKLARSATLAAMGLGALAGEAIRVSLPWDATDAEAEAFIAAYGRMAARLARRGAA